MQQSSKQTLRPWFFYEMSALCFPTKDYPKNHRFSSHLPALHYKNLIISTKKNYPKRYDKHKIKRLSKKKRK